MNGASTITVQPFPGAQRRGLIEARRRDRRSAWRGPLSPAPSAGASLKLPARRRPRPRCGISFPGAQRRGLIEARRRAMAAFCSAIAFPGAQRRGLIEARWWSSENAPQGTRLSPAPSAGASLKLIHLVISHTMTVTLSPAPSAGASLKQMGSRPAACTFFCLSPAPSAGASLKRGHSSAGSVEPRSPFPGAQRRGLIEAKPSVKIGLCNTHLLSPAPSAGASLKRNQRSHARSADRGPFPGAQRRGLIEANGQMWRPSCLPLLSPAPSAGASLKQGSLRCDLECHCALSPAPSAGASLKQIRAPRQQQGVRRFPRRPAPGPH